MRGRPATTRPSVWRREVFALLRLGAPLALNNVFSLGVQLTNTVLAGRSSADDLAAVALGGNLWLPLYIFGLGVVMSVSPTMAQHWGAADIVSVRRTARHGLWLALAVSVPIVLVLAGAGAMDLFAAVGLPATVTGPACDYLAALAWGAPAMFLFQSMRCASEGLGHTVPVMWVAALGLAVHVVSGTVLVFGIGPVPAFGAAGCGMASALAMWAMALVMAAALRWTMRYRHFGLAAMRVPFEMRALAALARLGLPIGFSMLMESSLFAGAAFMMGYLGATIIAAHQVVMNYSALMFMVPLGLASAVTVRVGQAIGRADPEAATRAAITGAACAALFMGTSALVMVCLGEAILALYTPDAHVLASAALLLPFAAAFQVVDGLQVAAAGALRGARDVRVPMLLTVCAYWGAGLPCSWVVGVALGFGPRGVWLGLCVGLVSAAVLLWLRFRVIAVRGLLRQRDAAPVEPVTATQ